MRLAEEIRRHDALYYNHGETELTDDEYDALVQREAEFCREYPEFLERYQEESGLGSQATRFGGRVGAAVSQQQQRQTHLRPMLSLDNVHTNEQLMQWLERIRTKLMSHLTTLTIVTEPKLDGLSLSLRYTQSRRDGTRYQLLWASTRGDGTEGQDVTHAVQSLHGIPRVLVADDAPTSFEVRGEVILPTSKFQGLQTSFSNARNAASGILLRKAKELDQEDKQLQSHLRFYAYDIVTADENPFVDDGVKLQSKLSNWGFEVPRPTQVATLQVVHGTEWNQTDLQPLLDFYHDLEQHRQGLAAKMDWGDYEMDGVVHKVSQLSLRAQLGNTNRFPRWAVAHKFPAETALTSLTGLDVQVGRTGALTPVALLEPVDIAGVSVRRATLHNFGILQELMGGTSVPVGTKVLVRRAGDVIPQVVQRVLEDETNANNTMISLKAPDFCPACGSPTKVEKLTTKNSTEGQVVRCGGPSLSCPPRAVGALAHAFCRDALDVKGLSEARIQQLLDADVLRTPADLFRLVANKDGKRAQKIVILCVMCSTFYSHSCESSSGSNSSDTILSEIAELPGWGTKSAQNLANVASMISTKGISLARFIYSLGIRHVGQHNSKLIASAYGTVDAFLSAVEDVFGNDEPGFRALVGSNDTEGTKGIGPAQISSLKSFATEAKLVKAARELANAIPVHDEIARNAIETTDNRPWQGYTVVFTGSLPNNLSRAKAQELAQQLGAKATPQTVSKSTDVVVAGEKGGKKLVRASELGIRIIEAEEFVKIVEEYTSSIIK